MTNINQTSVKTLKKSKAWFALLIVCILILIGVSGYLIYAKNLLRDIVINNVAKTDDASDIIANNTTNTTDNQSTAVNSQASAGWKEYRLTSCGIKIFIPSSWLTDNNLNGRFFVFNSPTSINNKTKDWEDKGPKDIVNDLKITCYQSLDEMTRDSWLNIQKKYPDFTFPIDLFDALTRKNPVSGFTIFTTSDVKKIKHGGKEAIIAIEGGEIMMTNYYFQKEDSLIIEFSVYIDDAYGNKNLDIANKEPQNTILKFFDWL